MIYGTFRFIRAVLISLIFGWCMVWLASLVCIQFGYSHQLDRIIENGEYIIGFLAVISMPFFWRWLR